MRRGSGNRWPRRIGAVAASLVMLAGSLLAGASSASAVSEDCSYNRTSLFDRNPGFVYEIPPQTNVTLTVEIALVHDGLFWVDMYDSDGRHVYDSGTIGLGGYYEGLPLTTYNFTSPPGVEIAKVTMWMWAWEYRQCTVTVNYASGTSSEVSPEEQFGMLPWANFIGDPVNTATGNFVDTAVDLDFPALAQTLNFERTYNALDERSGALGKGWHNGFDVSVDEQSDQSVQLAMGSGRVVSFKPQASGYSRPEAVYANLIKRGDGTFELAHFSGEIWRFDSNGRLASVQSWDGQSTTYTYDSSGLVTHASHTAGYGIDFSYQNGRLADARAADGRVVTYAYDSSGNLAAVTDPVCATTTYGHDAFERITTITDADGVVLVANTYDATGRVARQATPGGTATYAYDDAGRVTTVTDEATAKTSTFTHDSTGHLTEMSDILGNSAARSFDDAGNLVSATDRRGEQTTMTYNEHSLPTQRKRVDGATTTLEYDIMDRLVRGTGPTDGEVQLGYETDGRIPPIVTDATGAVSNITSADGLVTSVSDPDAVVTTYAYDEHRNLAAITSAAGDTTTYEYDAVGRRTKTTTPLGNVSTRAYDGVGRLTKTTDPNGAMTTYAYSPAGRVRSVTDPVGAVSAFAYDAKGHLITTTDANGAATIYAYNSHGLIEAITHPDGTIERFDYDAAGRLVTSTDATGAVTNYTHDAEGHLTSVTDPTGAVTTRAYDMRGRLVRLMDPLGNATTYSYDAAGRPTSTTDPTAAVRTTTYDLAGRVKTTIDPLGATTEHTYTPSGRLASLIDPLGNTTTFSYDTLGRLVALTSPLGHVTRTSYDRDSRVSATTTPNGLVTRFAYDPAGRLVARTDARGKIWKTSYSARGEVLAERDPTGALQQFVYDPVGNLIKATDANAALTTFAYDTRRNQVKMTDANGGVTASVYDAAGRLTAETDALGRTTTSTYDPAGRLVASADPSGRTTAFVYDPAGRLVARTYGDNSSVAYTYDPAGRRTSMVDATGTTTYAYDAAGQPRMVSRPDGTTIGADYDAVGRRVGLTYPDATTATSTYDADGNLTGVAHPSGTVTYQLNADGQVVKASLPGNFTRQYSYEGGLLSAVNEARGLHRVASTLDRDAAGRITNLSTGRVATAYAYDPAGQLISVQGGDNATYAYDAVGNRISERHNNGVFGTRIPALGDATTYTYDLANQLTSAKAGGRVTTYSYDEAGRLVKTLGPQETLTHSYDAQGRLSSTKSTPSRGLFSTAFTAPNDDQGSYLAGHAITTDRVYDGDGALVELIKQRGTVSRTQRLAWDTQTRGPPQVLASTGAGGDATFVYGHERELLVRNGASEPFARDALGSSVTTAATRDFTASHSYDAFGESSNGVLDLGATGAIARFGYRGELNVSDTIHLRARDYDPNLGRFSTKDPLSGIPGTPSVANAYPYANNDPLNQIDPTGNSPFWIGFVSATPLARWTLLTGGITPYLLGGLALFVAINVLTGQDMAAIPDALSDAIDSIFNDTNSIDQPTNEPRPPELVPPVGQNQCNALQTDPTCVENRGRIQVQGKSLRMELSWAWSSPTPPTAAEGLAGLEGLWQQLPGGERRLLDQAFEQARTFIRHCAPGGCPPPGKNGMTNRGVRGSDARVDIEIITGLAFT